MRNQEKQDASSNRAEINRAWKAKAETLREELDQQLHRFFGGRVFGKVAVAPIYQDGLIIGLDYCIEGTVRK